MQQIEEPRPRRKWRRISALGLVLAVGVVAIAGRSTWPFQTIKSASAVSAAPTAIPVITAKAELRDLPIERSGIGTVTSLNAIDVKFRADGQLQHIAFTEGHDVDAGEVLAQIDPRPYQAQLAQTEAAYQKDQASLNNAKADEGRASRLSQTGAGTQQAIDTARAQVAVLTAALAGDQAAIDMAKLNLEFTTVKAPIAGRVGLRQIDEGAIVHGSDSSGLVSITQIAPIGVLFSLPQRDLPALLAGQTHADLTVSVSTTEGAQHLADGKLGVIDSQVDASTGMVRLKAYFQNEDRILWPGELVTARIRLSIERSAIVAPSAAIQNGQNGSYVFVVAPDHSVSAVTVKVGPTVDGYTQLLSGVSAGQEIVLDGQSRLTNGTMVKPQLRPVPATAGEAS
ncbi:efflux RND transporter periplasmic adaptor subunit [Labrys neptuniae]